MDNNTNLIDLLNSQPCHVINLKIIPKIKSNAAFLLAILMEKAEKSPLTDDGFIVLSAKEMENLSHLKRGRQQSGIKILEKHNFIISKPKEGSRKRQFKINYDVADPDGSYREAIQREINKTCK